jgi:cobalt-zinc-cadmium efflux system membrane fusion protein
VSCIQARAASARPDATPPEDFAMKVRAKPLCTATALVAALLAGCRDRGHEGHDHSGHGHDEHGHEGHAEPGEHAGHSDEVKLTPEAMKRGGVRVEKASKAALVPTYVAPARVALDLDAMAHVGVPVRGRVREMRVKRGDVVEKGAVLFVLDSPELGAAQNEFLEKRVAAETLAPAVEIAKSAYERGKRLFDAGGNMTLTEVQRREAEMKTAEAAVITAKASVTTAENTLHLLGMKQEAVDRLAVSREIDTTVVIASPIAGAVLDRHVTLGELVSPDVESLIVLADTSVVWVFAHVPETRLSEAKPDAAVRLRVAAFPGRVLEGRVASVPPKMDETTRTAEIRIDVKDAKGLRPGMYAQAEIVMGDAQAPVLAIPQEAVQTVEGGPAVFVPVPNEADTFAKRAVRVGEPVSGLLPVLEGLAEGESYVAAGSFLLKAELGKAGAAHEH